MLRQPPITTQVIIVTMCLTSLPLYQASVLVPVPFHSPPPDSLHSFNIEDWMARVNSSTKNPAQCSTLVVGPFISGSNLDASPGNASVRVKFPSGTPNSDRMEFLLSASVPSVPTATNCVTSKRPQNSGNVSDYATF